MASPSVREVEDRAQDSLERSRDRRLPRESIAWGIGIMLFTGLMYLTLVLLIAGLIAEWVDRV